MRTKTILLAPAAVMALAALTTALPSSAGASSTANPKVRNGYYASLVGHPSADVEFHVRASGSSIPHLSLGCTPDAANAQLIANSGYASIAVLAPTLRIRHGRVSDQGTAMVTADYAGAPTVAETTLTISLTHVSGPVVHYRFEGIAHSETTAWKGNASSPACASVADHGKVTLFGPVAGE